MRDSFSLPPIPSKAVVIPQAQVIIEPPSKAFSGNWPVQYALMMEVPLPIQGSNIVEFQLHQGCTSLSGATVGYLETGTFSSCFISAPVNFRSTVRCQLLAGATIPVSALGIADRVVTLTSIVNPTAAAGVSSFSDGQVAVYAPSGTQYRAYGSALVIDAVNPVTRADPPVLASVGSPAISRLTLTWTPAAAQNDCEFARWRVVFQGTQVEPKGCLAATLTSFAAPTCVASGLSPVRFLLLRPFLEVHPNPYFLLFSKSQELIHISQPMTHIHTRTLLHAHSHTRAHKHAQTCTRLHSHCHACACAQSSSYSFTVSQQCKVSTADSDPSAPLSGTTLPATVLSAVALALGGPPNPTAAGATNVYYEYVVSGNVTLSFS